MELCSFYMACHAGFGWPRNRDRDNIKPVPAVHCHECFGKNQPYVNRGIVKLIGRVVPGHRYNHPDFFVFECHNSEICEFIWVPRNRIIRENIVKL